LSKCCSSFSNVASGPGSSIIAKAMVSTPNLGGYCIKRWIELQLLNLGAVGVVGVVGDDPGTPQRLDGEVRKQYLGVLVRNRLCLDCGVECRGDGPAYVVDEVFELLGKSVGIAPVVEVASLWRERHAAFEAAVGVKPDRMNARIGQQRNIRRTEAVIRRVGVVQHEGFAFIAQQILDLAREDDRVRHAPCVDGHPAGLVDGDDMLKPGFPALL
jgi:hypothetical protein